MNSLKYIDVLKFHTIWHVSPFITRTLNFNCWIRLQKWVKFQKWVRFLKMGQISKNESNFKNLKDGPS